MAITQTGAIYKAFSFDNVSSRDYGVYITSEAVYNAPERDVEMISIPGRNGTFALDKGRFENIEVTYPAGIFADNETDFAQAVSDFRNYLCSKKGYFRLTDEYNPDEYRMAVYKSGLEISPVQLKAGEFEIIFECKPQRWLTEGETALTVVDGEEITNPTLFDASPMLEVEGYGTIGFNGYDIELDNAMLGDVTLSNAVAFTTDDKTVELNTDLLNNGDIITIGESKLSMRVEMPVILSATVSDSNNEFSTVTRGIHTGGTHLFYLIETTVPSLIITKGSSVSKTNTVSVTGDYLGEYQARLSYSVTCDITVTADASGISVSRIFTVITGAGLAWSGNENSTIGACTGYSTKGLLGHPTYIDCEYGEAYRIDNDTMKSLNKYIDLGSDLPKLAPGDNTMSFDDTITNLKIVPRWWKV